MDDIYAKILAALARLEATGAVTHENVVQVRKDIREQGERLRSLEQTRSWQKGAARVVAIASVCITAVAGWFFKS